MKVTHIPANKPPFKIPTTSGEKICADCGKIFKSANARTAKYCPNCKQKRRQST